jgi:hypothetical protein
MAELTREQLEKAREAVLEAKSDARHMMFAGPLMEAMLAQFDADTRRFREMEWAGHNGTCKGCGFTPRRGHSPSCWLAARIALGEVDHGTA